MSWNISPLNSVATYMTCEAGVLEFVDFPETEEPVWIVGKKYSTIYDLPELRQAVQSKLWLTYRKNFHPIGGTGPTSDSGWGCMLRCGQMVLAQALIRRHLGRDWIWNPEKPFPDEYLKILRMFQDTKCAPYSIHQIAQMGVTEGKDVGQWFGPNTVAHVIKKLVIYDDWSSLVVHVAMDNAVIIDDIKLLCKSRQETVTGASNCEPVRNRRDVSLAEELNNINNKNCVMKKSSSEDWRPLLLFIPLRLGLSDINSLYIRALKTTFTMKQSLGIIGGRPNHALYFIGFLGKELVFLDPHTAQNAVSLDGETVDDSSYHCSFSGRMDINQLDPSIALCYYCESESDFDHWCSHVHKLLIAPEKQPLFELSKERPAHWPPFQPMQLPDGGSSLEFTMLEKDRRFDTSDDEFELL